MHLKPKTQEEEEKKQKVNMAPLKDQSDIILLLLITLTTYQQTYQRCTHQAEEHLQSRAAVYDLSVCVASLYLLVELQLFAKLSRFRSCRGI